MRAADEELFGAVTNNDPDWVRSCLERGADPNAVEAEDRRTVLMAAVGEGTMLETARMLLDAGARIDAVDETGDSALHAAAVGHGRDWIELLIAHGARRDLRNHAGKTAFDRGADSFATREVLEFLRPSASQETPDQLTALLMKAAEEDDAEAIRALAARGADPSRPDRPAASPRVRSLRITSTWGRPSASIRASTRTGRHGLAAEWSCLGWMLSSSGCGRADGARASIPTTARIASPMPRSIGSMPAAKPHSF